MKIPKRFVLHVATTIISVGILSATVPMLSYAAESENIKEANPVTEDVVYEVYGEIGGGKASIDETKLHDICEDVASNYEYISASLLHALCIQESRGRKNVNDIYKNASALGITQIEPSVHEKEIKQLGYTNDDIRNNPEASIMVAAEILNNRIKARNGNIYKALIDYNMGQTKTDQKFKNNPNYKWEYADNVIKVAAVFEKELEESNEYV